MIWVYVLLLAVALAFSVRAMLWLDDRVHRAEDAAAAESREFSRDADQAIAVVNSAADHWTTLDELQARRAFHERNSR